MDTNTEKQTHFALSNSLPTATMQQSTAVENCVFAKAEIFAVQTEMDPLTWS